jgi:hypothetical protein
MIILFSKDKALIKSIKHGMENLVVVNDLLDCQLQLVAEDLECDILILDCLLVDKQIDTIIDYIVKKEPFIKNIILYYDETKEVDVKVFNKHVARLQKARYKTNLIKLNQLVLALQKF